jgi:predicted metal-binding membrane protein
MVAPPAPTSASAGPILGRPSVWIGAAVAASWLLCALLLLAGHGDLVSHHAVVEQVLSAPLAVVTFVLVWELMITAMMLPSAMPVIGIVARVAARGPRPGATLALFLAAYFAVWTAFAGGALLGDAGLHWLVHRWSWLHEHEHLITASLLIGAGAFQLTPLKERCLTECRNPLQFVWRRYAPGVAGAWRLGVAHAMFCVGCCWALMLVMFALGMESLVLMAVVTGVMVAEKSWRSASRLVPVVSAALIGLGLLVGLAPDALSALPRLP